MKRVLLLIALIATGLGVRAENTARPNILLIMADDWSWPDASVLSTAPVKTPTFDRVASEGVVFANAYAASPTRTPSRLSIASGQWPWRLDDVMERGGYRGGGSKSYAALLQAAGYSIGSTEKGTESGPDKFTRQDLFGRRFESFEKFLAQQKSGVPFCFWYGIHEPRGSSREAERRAIDPTLIKLPACLPNNSTTLDDFRDYLCGVQRFDAECANALALLEKSGLLDNTVVVISSLNGMAFPRCKGTLYATGTHVPLAIRWGAKVPGQRTISDPVSLVDLAPTLLTMAGLEPPLEMSGRTLLPILTSNSFGKVEPTRTYVLAGAERYEYPCPSRAIRTAQFSYIMNYDLATWHPVKTSYPELRVNFKSGEHPVDTGAYLYNIDPSPTKQYLLEHRTDGEMQPLFAMACGDRPEEELYDLRKDPQERTNVAADPNYKGFRNSYRSLLLSKLQSSQDPRNAVAGYETRVVEGWTVLINEDLVHAHKEVTDRGLELVTSQLREIIRVVPPRPVEFLRTVPIWISGGIPEALSHGEYKVDPSWLISHYRNPAKAKAIELTDLLSFEKDTQVNPCIVLHELAHAYHDQVLGWDHREVKFAYDQARASGTYDHVERANFPGHPRSIERAYAMTNEFEYFAECTEAFFGQSDFYPFNRQDLKDVDPGMFRVLQKAWQVPEE